MRYICALLEAEIVRHPNPRLAMKVSRLHKDTGLSSNTDSTSTVSH
jgi:hypothetical protein